ncbi:uncharacterized protein LOC129598446 [Paramacrobiotus metropolitanus]|uniref:uncharacterized protein LOC129598446 n=1 Tax=Paramacrobiotus metropolitanus TaxID=2943436 RepID=UPI0024456EC8|nr:uncharacterized protein LOC129598446 [Paramacrobiotus metropolitanus]
MQDNKPNTKYLTCPQEFYKMLLSGEFHIHSWDMFSEDVLQVAYTREKLFIDQNPHTNVVLAAFTTCWARLHLYGYMEQVQDTLLYFDTDSIIFVEKPGAIVPPTGKFLGDLTDELQPDQFITQFVSLGPKTYSYKTNDGKSVAKVKGFTLNGQTSESITAASPKPSTSNIAREIPATPLKTRTFAKRRAPEMDDIKLNLAKKFKEQDDTKHPRHAFSHEGSNVYKIGFEKYVYARFQDGVSAIVIGEESKATTPTAAPWRSPSP